MVFRQTADLSTVLKKVREAVLAANLTTAFPGQPDGRNPYRKGPNKIICPAFVQHFWEVGEATSVADLITA